MNMVFKSVFFINFNLFSLSLVRLLSLVNKISNLSKSYKLSFFDGIKILNDFKEEILILGSPDPVRKFIIRL